MIWYMGGNLKFPDYSFSPTAQLPHNQNNAVPAATSMAVSCSGDWNKGSALLAYECPIPSWCQL